MPTLEEWLSGRTKDGKPLPLGKVNGYRILRGMDPIAETPGDGPVSLACCHRGQEVERIDCGCCSHEPVYTCSSSDNPAGKCTLRVVTRLAGRPRVTLPNCLDCKLKSIR